MFVLLANTGLTCHFVSWFELIVFLDKIKGVFMARAGRHMNIELTFVLLIKDYNEN